MRKSFLYSVCFLSTLVFFNATAQYYYPNQEVFGKNTIQTKRLFWKTIKVNNFEFNYYKGGEAAARKGIKIAEAEFNRITNVLGYTPYNDIKIFIYNNQSDLFQSNLSLNSVGDSKGGTVNLSRSRVQIPLSKDEAVFKRDLVRYIARLCVYDMLFGGSLKDAIQSNIMGELPEWFTNGVASYVAEPWSPEKNRKLVGLLNDDRVKKLGSFKGNDAILVGESIWNYIAIRYGNDNIANILNLTRVIRNEYTSIASTVGVPYSRFVREWRDYYLTGKMSIESERTTKESTVVQLENKPIVQQLRPKLDLREGEIDTENYLFDASVLKQYSLEKKLDTTKLIEKPSVILSKIPKNISKEDKAKKPPVGAIYENAFVLNETKNELVFDPFRRFGIKGTARMSDILENHHLNMGLLLTPNFKNTDLYAEYVNSARRIDYSIRYDKRSLDISDIDGGNTFLFLPLMINLPSNAGTYAFNRRAIMNQISLTALMPVSRNLRVSTTPFFTKATEIGVGATNLLREDLSSTFLGNRAEIVFDNTVPLQRNLLSGTRFKFRLENYFNAKLRRAENFNKIRLDLRHYQPVGRMIVALQFQYGQSGGRAPKPVVMGGVENWINRRVDDKPNKVEVFPTDIRTLLFTDFAPSLRGFPAFKLIGTRYLVSNNELRIPLAGLINSTTNSNFMKSFVLAPFLDIGSAWMGGRGPFKRQNSLNTQEIGGQGSAFRATVTDFKNPFFYGYGLGAKAMVFGYQVRVDYAWGVEDKVRLSPLLHLSIGSDF